MNKDSFKLETTFKDVNLGKHFTAAKESLKNFKEKIKELKGFNKIILIKMVYSSTSISFSSAMRSTLKEKLLS